MLESVKVKLVQLIYRIIGITTNTQFLNIYIHL